MDAYREELASLRCRFDAIEARLSDRDDRIAASDRALAERDVELKELRRLLERGRLRQFSPWRRLWAPLAFAGALTLVLAAAASAWQAAASERSLYAARVSELERAMEQSNARYRATLAEVWLLRERDRNVHGGAHRSSGEVGRVIATAIGGECEFFLDGVALGEGPRATVRTPANDGSHTVGCRRKNGEHVTTTIVVQPNKPALVSFSWEDGAVALH